ncbi:MAG: phosphatidate cytidylyltransferase [Deltaproteobacteria bacterium]|nr:phosphatidate cytidylyltransferase [Deltaproteobacteria bacterium]
MLRTRLATAAVAIPLLVWLIVWNPWSSFVWLVGVATLVGVTEYCAMAFPTDPWDRGFGLAAGGLLLSAMLVPTQERFAMALAAVVVAGLVLALARKDDLRHGVDALGLTLLGSLYTAFLLPHYVWMHALPDPVDATLGVGGWRWVIFTVVIAMAGDVGGYFGGRWFGRHKLMPTVSPGKTVEGSATAVLGNLLGGAFCKLAFFPTLDWAEVVGLGLAVGCLAQVGDLCESMLKRAFGAKDSGWIIPGHGGVLDRIDSLVFPAPLVYYYARFFFGH